MTVSTQMGRLLAGVTQVLQERAPEPHQQAVIELAKQIFSGQLAEDYGNRESSSLAASVMGSWAFIQQLDPDTPKVRIFNPDFQKHGWQLNQTVVTILCRNTPFLTDSVRGELNRRNLYIHLINSTVFTCIRDSKNQLLELLPARSVAKAKKGQRCSEEALLIFEIGRCTDKQELAEMRATLEAILAEVLLVVDDFQAMLALMESAQQELVSVPAQSRISQAEAQAFVEWIRSGFYTFLGYEYLDVSYEGDNAVASSRQGAQLGLLKIRNSYGHIELTQALNNSAQQSDAMTPVVFGKSSLRSRVHRLSYPDYIMLRVYDSQGKVIGEHRFMGLYTSPVYTLTPKQIPIIRQKFKEVLDRSDLDPTSHKGKDLARVLDVFPRDELFQSSVDELFNTTIAVNQIQERRQVRLFVRRDSLGKFVNCLVYTPRDIYRTELRVKIQDLLCNAFGAKESEFTTYFSESVLTRTHFVLRVDPRNKPEVDLNALEEEVVKVTMSWKEYLKQYLIEEFGDEQGSELVEQYAEGFSPGYMDDFEPRAAIDDIKKFLALDAPENTDDIAMSLYRRLGEDDKTLHFRLVHFDRALSLSDVMPILENLGLRVETEHPYGIKRKDGRSIWVHEFGLTFNYGSAIDINKVSDIFQESFLRIWEGDADNDAFNKLILGSQLGWRQIAMLRAYARYMKQTQVNFSLEYIAETLSNHLDITAQIVDYFNARFDTVASDRDEKVIRKAILDSLDSVENLTEDRIIRQYLAVIKATLRTNYFQRDSSGEYKTYISFKLSPRDIPDIPLPVPMFEIFVYSPRVEGVHLRGGKVARGGLRWSDRHEDYRTEVLGLVKAQQVKNAVIVPTGAKGGFVAKHLPSGDREAIQAEGIACYKIFIQGLLDVTDNLVNGEIAPPKDVVRKDEDDSYLVVAADKGTATFSDIANEISRQYNFWLGDAFASGGSVGYDHKKMGITARGAWVSVQRHFREMGINVQETDFTVVGIGDMAGDVFGNGMLLSPHIQLVCAFNHLHIFIDPNPDAAKSFVERQRLFNLPRSSWEDYDAALISKGGGVFRRSAKSIKLTPQMKARFAIDADQLTPTELIHAILKAPVDLLWNGGIGTYVKASSESHADVGDKANDALRVNGSELRCKVIGEGGNLGVTQLGRIEYALHGGRSNTDFIDNAAGVDCSDHEVNIKILLNGVVASADMTEKQRNVLLESMTDSVASLVLDNNYRQTQAISLAERDVLLRAGEYRRLIHNMEASGKLNRQLEFLPSDETLLERKASHNRGLTRPELSVLVSYVKSQLKESLVDDSLASDPYINRIVETAFPAKLREDFSPQLQEHRLRKEIIATQLANDLVNNMGITFIERLSQSTGVSNVEIARSYVIARDVFAMPAYWDKVEALDYQVDASVQMDMMAQLMRLVRRASRWFARNRRGNVDAAVEIDSFRDEVAMLREKLPELVRGNQKAQMEAMLQSYLDKGVEVDLANFIAATREVYPFLGIIEAAHTLNASTEKVAELYFALSEKLELDWFAKQISDLKIDNYWQAMARESYRDDLEWQLRNLTVGAMRHICEGGDVDACLDRWMEQQHHLVDRWQAMLAELHATEMQEFAMISVAIRELLDLAQSSKYG